MSWFAPALSQSIVKETDAIVDWDSARADAEKSSARLAEVKTFLDANNAELATIRLPVLMPDTSLIKATPRLRGQGKSYVIGYSIDGGKLSILGTSVFLVREGILVQSQNTSQASRTFDISEGEADLNIQKYGASYVLRLSCEVLNDERCLSDRFLNTIADSLIVVGGAAR
jgi:hypothetical protein